MSDRPSPEEQRSIIRNLEKTTALHEGVPAYVLAIPWYHTWNKSTDDIPCPPIDNTGLLAEGEFDYQNKLERHHFIIITQEIWNQLFEWYGGGPSIAVKVVQSKTGPVAVIRKSRLTIRYRDRVKEFLFHNFMPVSELLSDAVTAFAVPEDEEVALRNYWMGALGSPLVLTKVVREYVFSENQGLLLDRKVAGGWEGDVGQTVATQKTTVVYRRPDSSAQSWSRSVPGVVGLTNLGNTCYLNSGLQCLLHSMPLVGIFRNPRWADELNVTNLLGSRGEIARAFAALLIKTWSGENIQQYLSTSDMRNALGRFASQFVGYDQQDSQEALTFLLDGIHEDLNRITREMRRVEIEAVFGDGTNDLKTSEAAWSNHLKKHNSVVVDTFHGQLRCRLSCPGCQKISVVFDPFFCLSLPLVPPDAHSITLTFVPKHFREPREKMSLSVIGQPTSTLLSVEISGKIHRPVEVIVGSSDLNDNFLWDGSAFDPENVYAFEITSLDKFYVPCIVKGEQERTFTGVDGLDKTYTRPVVLAGPFLLEFDEPNPDEYTVATVAADSLSSIWSSSHDFTVTSDVTTFANTIVFPRVSCPSSQRFAVAFPERRGSLTPDRLDRSPFLKCATQKLIVLNVNPIFTTQAKGFSLLSLVRHYHRPTPVSANQTEATRGSTLDRCFAFYSAPEVLDEANQWFCPRCRNFVCAEKTSQIWSTPKCLIVHLKRFTASRKLDNEITYPDVLDVGPYVYGPQQGKSLTYRLYAVSEHMGSLGSGHYTAKALVGDEWYSFDDTTTRSISAQQAHSKSAYLLFYERNSSD